MLRPALALLALLLFCPAVYGQDHKQLEIEVTDQQLHRLWGKVRAARTMQLFMLAHIANRDGIQAAKTILSMAKQNFGQHVQMLRTEAEKDLSKSHWLAQGVGTELQRTAKLFREGGQQHLGDLEKVIAFLEGKGKGK